MLKVFQSSCENVDCFLLKYPKNVKEAGEVEDHGLQKCSGSGAGYSVVMGFWLAGQTHTAREML